MVSTRRSRKRTVSRRGFLGLGSNVGDRLSHLRAAVTMLGEREVDVVAASSTYETEPVGEILDQPDFLNAAIEIETELDPEAAARRLQGN